jgi:hypothetical protein
LTAVGGTGRYRWYSENESVALVRDLLDPKVTSGAVGRTRIVVQDAQNQFNSAAIYVEVAEVATLEWIEP